MIVFKLNNHVVTGHEHVGSPDHGFLVASSSAARMPRLLDNDEDEDGPVHKRFGTHGLWGVFVPWAAVDS